jgi:uroporphyrinogen-III synthase
MRLIVTRPGEQGERTAQALRARGHEALVAPVLRIEPCADADFGTQRCAAVLMTSANAARALMSHPRREALIGLPLFVVGEATHAAAREAGFTNIMSADGDVRALVEVVAARVPRRARVLYLAGEVRAGNLAGDLETEGLVVRTAIIYRAVLAASLPAVVAEALRCGGIDGVLHFSRRSAATFLKLVEAAGIDVNSLDCHHFCLSRQVAEPLIEAGVRAVAIAVRPDENAMLDLVDKR